MSLNFDLANFVAGDRMADLSLRGESDEQRSVDIYAIDEHPDNRDVHPDKVDELADSILEDGLGQWPLVRISPDDPSRYQHIAGWHRILAYRKIYEERKPGDENYATITVIVKKDCDDEKAERLMAATNLFTAGLSLEEQGKCYTILGKQIEEARAENPEAFKGKRTNEAVAEIASSKGEKVSASKVARAKKAYKDSVKAKEKTTDDLNGSTAEAQQPEPNVDKLNAEKRLDSLERSLDQLESYIEATGDVELNRQRLKTLFTRLKAIYKKIDKE